MTVGSHGHQSHPHHNTRMNIVGVVGGLAWANRRRRGRERFTSDKCVYSIPKVEKD